MKKAEYFSPVVTIFDQDGNVDASGNKLVYEHLIKGGVDGIVVMGSSGEFFAMSMEQRKQLIDIAVPCINHRVKCLVGTGCMTPKETVELSNYALQAGADAVMIIGPYYFTLGAQNIEWYYDQILPQIQGNVFLYNYPGGSGYDLTPEITLRLLRKHKNLVGYKDTVDNFGHTRALINATKGEFPDFIVMSGFDESLMHTMLSGGNGCIGGLSNIAPEICSAWVKAINAGNISEIEKYQKIINSLMNFYTINEPFLPAVKTAMALRGLDISTHCLEFNPITAEQVQQVEKILKDNGLK